ncbi:hypothetical protein [Nocardiopsis deserti]|uniref:hypothetical protein n=1 Tax=Nocardiopsis deserti TaxID=2605988 RepID=UPI00123B024F|nr:hypothetical protein [Nocardiopsis deserti]
MLPETLVALAAAGGTALVSAMAKDGWTATKQGFLRLVTRHTPEAATELEGELDRGHAELVAAPEPDLERTRAMQATQWQDRIARLLEKAPEMEPELRKWIQQSPIASIGGFTQTATAKDDAQQAVLGNGVQNVTFQKGNRE